MSKRGLEAAAEQNPQLKQVLGDVDKEEGQEKAKVDKVQKFNPKQLLGNPLQTVQDSELGEVQFGSLTIGDTLEIDKAEDSRMKGLLVLFYMLRKAYPDLTLEDVKSFPQDKATKLMALLSENAPFLKSAATM